MTNREKGEILLDGKNIKDYDLKSLYGTFGIIFQDFGKYAVTVEENDGQLAGVHGFQGGSLIGIKSAE